MSDNQIDTGSKYYNHTRGFVERKERLKGYYHKFARRGLTTLGFSAAAEVDAEMLVASTLNAFNELEIHPDNYNATDVVGFPAAYLATDVVLITCAITAGYLSWSAYEGIKNMKALSRESENEMLTALGITCELNEDDRKQVMAALINEMENGPDVLNKEQFIKVKSAYKPDYPDLAKYFPLYEESPIMTGAKNMVSTGMGSLRNAVKKAADALKSAAHKPTSSDIRDQNAELLRNLLSPKAQDQAYEPIAA